jgi:hypothetical protein
MKFAFSSAIFLSLFFGVQSSVVAGWDWLDGIVENVDALCARETFRVTDPNAVGPGGDKYCDFTTGNCADLRSALNSANLCSTDGYMRTIVLPEDGYYRIANADTPPAYRKTLRKLALARLFGEVGLPSVFGFINIEGNGATIAIADEVRDTRHFHVYPEGVLTLNHVTLTGAHTDFYGGAIDNEGRLNVNSSVFHHNVAQYGAAIYSALNAYIRVDQSRFSDSEAFSGAAIFVDGDIYADSTCSSGIMGAGEVEHSRFYNNSSTDEGVIGISRCERLFVRYSSIYGNRARAAILSDGDLFLQSSTISGNTGHGAGAIEVRGGSAVIESSTIAGNVADMAGAISCSGEFLDLSDVTITHNISNDERWAAVRADIGCDIIASNTVIGDNAFADCQNYGTGSIIERSRNITTDGSCFMDSVSAPLVLGGLSDNGGPTLTLLPDILSPLVNTGAHCLSVDQRGELRPYGSCDLGAVERQPGD